LNEPIRRLSASSHNCAAFTENDHVYCWGQTSNGKMGTKEIERPIDRPKKMAWAISQNLVQD